MARKQYLSDEAFHTICRYMSHTEVREMTEAEMQLIDAQWGTLFPYACRLCMMVAVHRMEGIGGAPGHAISCLPAWTAEAVCWLEYCSLVGLPGDALDWSMGRACVEEGYMLYLVMSSLRGSPVPSDVEYLTRMVMEDSLLDVQLDAYMDVVISYHDALRVGDWRAIPHAS